MNKTYGTTLIWSKLGVDDMSLCYIEKLKIKHIKRCVDMLDEQWDLGKKNSGAEGKICAWIYMFEILIYSTYLGVYIKDDQVVGIGGVYIYNCKNNICKVLFKIIQKILFHSSRIKFRDQLENYYKTYNYTPPELKKRFDGEISMLIVDSNMRGYGIGSSLFVNCCNIAKKYGAKNIKIDTDESCNFNFYLKNGCSKVYETTIEMGEKPKEKAFVLEKLL